MRFLPLLFLASLSLASPGEKASAKREKRRVTKASVFLVKAPSFLSPRVSSSIVRGESVEVEIPSTSGWYIARYRAQKGYLHQSYLADRAIAFQVSAGKMGDESTISGNYNLAVGGFTEGAEGHLRGKNSKDAALEQGFRWMDAFLPADYAQREASAEDPEGLARFIAEGKLREPGAAEEVVAQGERAR